MLAAGGALVVVVVVLASSNAIAVDSGIIGVYGCVGGCVAVVDVIAAFAAAEHCSGVSRMHWLLTSHEPHAIHFSLFFFALLKTMLCAHVQLYYYIHIYI